MPLTNFQINVTGTNTTNNFPATLTGTTAVLNKNFASPNNYSASVTVDGGLSQPISLTTNYTNLDTLIAALQAQTTGATWSTGEDQKLILTSNTGGTSSELDYEVISAPVELYIPDSDVFGSQTITTGATLIWPTSQAVSNGSAFLPQQVQVQNAGTSEDLSTGSNAYFGGAQVTAGKAPILAPGASETVPLEAGESLYMTAPNGATVDVRVVVTRT